MRHSKHTQQISLKKIPFSHRRKRKIPLREYFSNIEYYESERIYEDDWGNYREHLETK